MNTKSVLMHSLMALAAAIPAAQSSQEARAESATPAMSAQATESVEFASNLSEKLDGLRPDELLSFGEVWPRFDFTQIHQNVVGGPNENSLSPVEAFERVSKLA